MTYVYTYDVRLTTRRHQTFTTAEHPPPIRLRRRPRANFTSDGTPLTYSYDPNGNRASGLSTAGSDNRLMTDGTWNYSYDADGNETGKTLIADTKEFWTYRYDERNEMTTAIYEADVGGTSTVELTVDYGYDVYGNRIGETDIVDAARFRNDDDDDFVRARRLESRQGGLDRQLEL